MVVLKAEKIVSRSQNMDDLESKMNNKSLKKYEVRGALLEYFNLSGAAKLPAIW